MMDRRDFLKLTGLVAAAGALQAPPVAAAARAGATLGERAHAGELASAPSVARLAVREPGTYRISGRVRLLEPRVEISGIAHTQSISWSGSAGPERPVADFATFEHFDQPGLTPAIHVRGGQLEALALQPVDFA
jgi:hypothetical protein